ncbi:YdcF family protein [Arthrobacter sp. SA17]
MNKVPPLAHTNWLATSETHGKLGPVRISVSVQRLACRTSVVGGALFLLWITLSLQLFVNVDPLITHRTDAVIMLGGAASERLPVAQRVQTEYGIPVLVLSQTNTPGNQTADAVCNSTTFPSGTLVCFQPDNLDTRSEAREIAQLAAANNWKSITVVTSQYHVTRAQRLIGQCTSVEIQMVASHPDLRPAQWLSRFVVESGGLLDASLRPECGSD